MKVKGWFKSKKSIPKEQCPCCDYISLTERAAYIICEICFWEDDGIDIDRIDAISGPNHMTLKQGRNNFKEFGACDFEMLKNVISEEQCKNYKHQPREVD